MQEIWKDIEGYEGFYQVSNLGRLKGLTRYVKAITYRIVNEHMIKKAKDKDGYEVVTLSKNGASKTFKVHRLTATAFIPNTYKKPQINHKNGIKADNRIENLEWCTGSENMKHSYCIGLSPKKWGSDNPLSKFKGEKNRLYNVLGSNNPLSKAVYQYGMDLKLIKKWGSLIDVERDIGIISTSICKCCKGIYKTAGGYIWSYSEI